MGGVWLVAVQCGYVALHTNDNSMLHDYLLHCSVDMLRCTMGMHMCVVGWGMGGVRAG